jgi:hypothetical protein
VGGELINKEAVQKRRADILEDLTQKFVQIVRNARRVKA